MKCPGCSSMVNKIKLDVYYCPTCNKTWLIKRLTKGKVSDTFLPKAREGGL